MAGDKRKREQKVGGGAAGVLVVGGTLLAAALAAAWTARGARRRRKEKAKVNSKEDFDLVPTSPLPNHELDTRRVDAEDADVTQSNVSISRILEQDQKTCIVGGQINLVKTIVEVQDLAGDQSSEIEVPKDNPEVVEGFYPTIPSEVDVEHLTYHAEEIQYETSPSQDAEIVQEIGEETLPILYDEVEDIGDNVLRIGEETSLAESESISEEDNVLRIGEETSLAESESISEEEEEEEEETEVSSLEEDNKGDEKSEISRDSSVESNTVVVWPAEMVEEHDLPPLVPVEMKISNGDELHKRMENSHVLFRNEVKDKLMAIKPATTKKARRPNFEYMAHPKSLLLMLVLALAIGIFSFVHHRQLAYIYEQFCAVIFPLQNNAL